MESKQTFTEMYREMEGKPEYIAAGFAIEALEAITIELEKRGKSQADVARELGMSRAQVSKLFSGEANMTLLTLAKLASVAGKRPTMKLVFL